MSHNNTTVQGIAPLANADIPLTLSSVVSPGGDGVLGYDGAGYTSLPTTPSLTWSRKASVFTVATAANFTTSAYYYDTTSKWAWEWRTGSSAEILAGGASITLAVSPPTAITNSVWGMAVALPAGSYLVKWAINTDQRLGTGDASLRLWLATSTAGTTGQYVGNTLRLFASERHGGHLIAAMTTTATRYLFARVTATNGNFGIIQDADAQKPDFIDIRSYT